MRSAFTIAIVLTATLVGCGGEDVANCAALRRGAPAKALEHCNRAIDSRLVPSKSARADWLGSSTTEDLPASASNITTYASWLTTPTIRTASDQAAIAAKLFAVARTNWTWSCEPQALRSRKATTGISQTRTVVRATPDT